jgi:hypothetical protein
MTGWVCGEHGGGKDKEFCWESTWKTSDFMIERQLKCNLKRYFVRMGRKWSWMKKLYRVGHEDVTVLRGDIREIR